MSGGNWRSIPTLMVEEGELLGGAVEYDLGLLHPRDEKAGVFTAGGELLPEVSILQNF